MDAMNAESFSTIPDTIMSKSHKASGKLVSTQSAARYEKEYQQFCDWKKEHGVIQVEENVMLAYFLDASKKGSSSSLWPRYSMLKSTLLVQENINIAKFNKLTAFLKKCNVGYQPRQSKILTREEVNRFLKEAPDDQYLLAKVVAMLGIAGGCRREELYSMTLNDVEDTGTQLVVTIPHTKTNVRRIFSVINEADGINYLKMFRKYTALRPQNLQEKMLFVGYRQGKCISQRVGIHSIGGVPRKIAEYLKLEHPERYTGHCFRRTSATLLANAGADLSVLKRHGAWKSSSVAEKYVENSIEGKVKIARMIQGGENFVEVLQQRQTNVSTSASSNNPGISVTGNTNCSITVHVNIPKT